MVHTLHDGYASAHHHVTKQKKARVSQGGPLAVKEDRHQNIMSSVALK